MNKREMLVDLTSLLDVILIILFMVLMSSQTITHNQVENLQAELDTLRKTQMPMNQSQKIWQKSFAEDIGKINIIYPTDTNLSIQLMFENGDLMNKPESIDLLEWLKEMINEMDEEVIMVSFTYDSQKIYNKEYRNVLEIIQRLNRLQNKKILYSEFNSYLESTE